jgi:DNA repair protein RecN (Recombination protein N)
MVELSECLLHLEETERDRQHRLDLLSHQSREIAEADLKVGEEEELGAEHLLLQNAERLADATQKGYETLYGAEGAACERLDAVAAVLEETSEVDPVLGQLAETVRTSLYAMEDVAAQLRDYAGKTSFEPGRQNEVEQRLALLAAWKRKYAPTLEGILDYKAEIDREIEKLADADATKDSLHKEIEDARERLQKTGEGISLRRREAAQRLRSVVERELKDLAMAKAHLEVKFFPLTEPGPRGLERGEFYLSSNPGEEPKPLAWIASGGELSRIMLALKRAVPDGDGTPTLVFDEVDAGIGGVSASAVGEKLREVAQGLQVLCITHLPQVAGFADHHYRVEKRQEQGRTFTTLVLLEGEERVSEMARMLGGAQVTGRTLEHAREIIVRSHSGPMDQGPGGSG